jgi:hypothetical protein
MNTRHIGILMLGAAALLGGCGELSYKRGAGAGDLQQARAQCAKTHSSEADIERCLTDQGWTITRFDNSSPLAVVTVNPDNRTSAPAPAGTQQGTTSSPAQASVPPDPMQLFNVASWWKMGGNPGDLATSMSTCSTRLGEAHRPKPGVNLYTRAMVICLKEFGWTGLQDYATQKPQ